MINISKIELLKLKKNKKEKTKTCKDLQSEVNVKKQEKIDITTGSLKKILGGMSNWKSPGPEGFG